MPVSADHSAVVTGASGQLGAALLAEPAPGWSVHGLTRADCDISDERGLARMLDQLRPRVLINAAAYTAVDRAESEREAAYAANAGAPGSLARACAARGIRLLHVSTDFVFDGSQGAPYSPDASPRPLGVYGESKLAGEEAVRASDADWLILRTGWVYSRGGQNFLQTMLRLHREHDELSVVADQVGTPTAAASLAAALWAAAARPQLRGVYHWSDAGVCSWYDFAVAIGEEAMALGLLPAAASVLPIPSEEYPTPARRPHYSVLDKSASWRDFELPPTHWRAALRRELAAMREEKNA